LAILFGGFLIHAVVWWIQLWLEQFLRYTANWVLGGNDICNQGQPMLFSIYHRSTKNCDRKTSKSNSSI